MLFLTRNPTRVILVGRTAPHVQRQPGNPLRRQSPQTRIKSLHKYFIVIVIYFNFVLTIIMNYFQPFIIIDLNI